MNMSLSAEVTRHALQLDAQDSVTGWFDVTWNESTIDMIPQSSGATSLTLPSGSYARAEVVGRCADVVKIGDRIENVAGVFFEVKTIKEHWNLNSFAFRECHMTMLPSAGLSYPTTTPAVRDARWLTKDYWQDYISDDNLQGYNWIVCYSDPPYPLMRVFRDKYYDIIFAVSQPVSDPLVDGAQEIYGYEEHVPTHIFTLDTKLAHLAETELRRIAKDYPDGSRRTLDRRASRVIELGSTKLYDTEFILNYRRLA